MKPLLHKNETPVRIDDKTVIFIPAGQDIEKAKQKFLDTLNHYHSMKHLANHEKGFRG